MDISGKQKSEGIKTSIHGSRKGHRRVHKKNDSNDCDDDEYYSDEEMNRSDVAQEEGKLKERLRNFGKKELSQEKQKLSGLGIQENLKSESKPYKTNETDRGANLFLTRSGETGNQSKTKGGTFVVI